MDLCISCRAYRLPDSTLATVTISSTASTSTKLGTYDPRRAGVRGGCRTTRSTPPVPRPRSANTNSSARRAQSTPDGSSNAPSPEFCLPSARESAPKAFGEVVGSTPIPSTSFEGGHQPAFFVYILQSISTTRLRYCQKLWIEGSGVYPFQAKKTDPVGAGTERIHTKWKLRGTCAKIKALWRHSVPWRGCCERGRGSCLSRP